MDPPTSHHLANWGAGLHATGIPRWLTSVIGSYPADLGDPGCTTISVFMQRWLHRLPMPFGPKDHDVVA